MFTRSLGYLVIVLAIVISGCICSSIPTPKSGGNVQGTIQGSSISPTIVAATPMPAMATLQAVPPKPFDLNGVQWMEYKSTGNANGQPYQMTVRLECGSSAVNGGQSQHYKRTVTTTGTSAASAYGSGKLFSFSSSSSWSSASSGMDASLDRMKSEDPVLSVSDQSLKPLGQESITVPKGTFNSMKYLGTFKGADCTYWSVPGVPVPVKVYSAADGTTMELSDWG